MQDNSALGQFRHGMQLLRDGCPAEAYHYFDRAVGLAQQNAYYLSFLGVSVARGQQNWVAATELCETALSLKRTEARLYLNLAEVYVSGGRRKDAVAVLDKGLIYFRNDDRIKRARAKLGKRCPSFLPFLERGHFLNRSLGKLRHRLFRSGYSDGVPRLGADSFPVFQKPDRQDRGN